MDRYHTLGPKRKVRGNTLEAALMMVRYQWPTADFEGSTGFERSSAVRENDAEWLVAHTWQSRRGQWWIRIASQDSRLFIR